MSCGFMSVGRERSFGLAGLSSEKLRRSAGLFFKLISSIFYLDYNDLCSDKWRGQRFQLFSNRAQRWEISLVGDALHCPKLFFSGNFCFWIIIRIPFFLPIFQKTFISLRIAKIAQ